MRELRASLISSNDKNEVMSGIVSIFKQHSDDQNFSVAFGIKIDVFLIGLRTPALSLTC